MPVRFEDDLADEPGGSSSPAGGGAHAAGQPLASAFGQRQSGVDWEELDEELYHVAPEFKDPRFDSLHHVLGILGAVDSEAALDEARRPRAGALAPAGGPAAGGWTPCRGLRHWCVRAGRGRFALRRVPGASQLVALQGASVYGRTGTHSLS
jgi:hypothetical protein